MVQRKKTGQGLATLVISLGWSAGALTLISVLNHHPAVSWGENKFIHNWIQSGSIFHQLLYWFSHPLMIMKIIWTKHVAQLLLATAFLPLFTPWGILTFLPVFLNAASHNPLQAHFELYYAAPIIPFLFLGTVWGINQIEKKWESHANLLLVLVGFWLIVFNTHKFIPDKISSRHLWLHEKIAGIAAEIPVAAQGNLIPHLRHREVVHLLPQITDEDQWVVLDLKSNPYPMDEKQRETLLQNLKTNPAYFIRFQNDGFYILGKK